MIISPVHFPIYKLWPRADRGNSFFEHPFYFRRGSWALVYGIQAIARKRGKRRVRVWFPDYFCKEPLEILKRFPVDIAYYPVQKNLRPNFEILEHMVKLEVPDVFVLVHYFGFPNDLSGAKRFCDPHDIELIEDCAHMMRPHGEVGLSGALSIWSPWKFFPLPDLGMLWARDDLRGYVETGKPHGDVLSFLQWYFKRQAQRVLCVMGVNWYKGSHNSSQPSLLVGGGEYHQSPPQKARGGWEGLCSYASPNTLSLRLFRAYRRNAETISAERIENYNILDAFFREKYPERLLFEATPKDEVPYAFPCLTSTRAHEISQELVRHGIPAYAWPDLPDNVINSPEQHRDAHWLAHHVLLFPVHQNVSARQISYMKQQFARIC